MKVSAQYAAEHFDDMVAVVDSGGEVEISRLDKPSLKLVVSQELSPVKRTGPRILGAGKALLRVPSEQEWAEMDKEIEESMSSPIFPVETNEADRNGPASR